MHAKKLLSMLLTALLVVTLLAGCYNSNFSKEAADALNRIQDTVAFETASQLTQALKNALKDNVQTSAVRDAILSDENLQSLLTSGYQLDVFAVNAGNAEEAAEMIAQNAASLVAGKKSEGKIAMVLADNGYYYVVVLTYRDNSGGQGGDDEQPAPPTVSNIVITNNSGISIPLTFVEGQDIESLLQGMTLTAYYSDGTPYVITNYSISPTSFETAGTHQLTITFVDADGQEVSFDMSVTVVEATIQSITVSTQPVKTNYAAGEQFDPAGLSILVTYTNEKSETIAYNDHANSFSWSPDGQLEEGTDSVTVTYQGKAVAVPISVGPARVVFIEVTKVPDKTTYYEGESLNTDGMTVTAIYTDNSKKEIAGYTCSPTKLTEAGTQTIEVTYEQDGMKVTAMFDVTVEKLVPESISISGNYKKNYSVGDYFDPSGVIVTVKYSNGTEKMVTDYTHQKNQMSQAKDNQKVWFYYTENGKEVKNYIEVKVIPKLTVEMDKTEFTQGEMLSGETVYLEETLGAPKKITRTYYTIEPETLAETGTNISVRITYTKNTDVFATVSVTVIAPPNISATDNSKLQGYLTNINNAFKSEVNKYSELTLGDQTSDLQNKLNKALDNSGSNSTQFKTLFKQSVGTEIDLTFSGAFFKSNEFEEGRQEETYYFAYHLSGTYGTGNPYVWATTSSGYNIQSKLKTIIDKIDEINDPYGTSSYKVYYSITDYDSSGLVATILVERTRTKN